MVALDQENSGSESADESNGSESNDSESSDNASTRRRLLSRVESQQRLRAGEPPFDPPPVNRRDVRGSFRIRNALKPTVFIMLFGGASERGLVASEQESSGASIY